MIKIAFFGSRPLGRKILEYLYTYEIEHSEWVNKDIAIVGVVSFPDPQGKWWEGSINDDWLTCEEKDLPDFDILISVLYPKIIPESVLSRAKIAINLHTGLLPEYRGRNGAAHVILNGGNVYGATLHKMDKSLDTGDIIGVKKFKVKDSDTCEDVYHNTEDAAFKLFVEKFPLILTGNFRTKKQTCGGCYYGKNSLDSKEVDLNWRHEKILRFVRAMYFPPHEKAYVLIGGNKVYLSPK